jgi:CheY-like chemotaxis protein
MKFTTQLHNRLEFPTHHVMICEDDLNNQVRFTETMQGLFPPQGKVQFDFMCSALGAAAVMQFMKIDLLILDHDMPYGFGSQLILYMAENNLFRTPIITASGIRENNVMMYNLAKTFGIDCYQYMKEDVFYGKTNNLIKVLLSKEYEETREKDICLKNLQPTPSSN